MTLKRAVSACLPSYFVDRVRAKRLAQELAERQRLDREAVELERAAREATSWDDAERRAAHYDDAMLTEFRLARSVAHKPCGSLLVSNVLGLVAALDGRPDLTVTDFGGSTGELGRDFLMRFPASQYVVVDLPALVFRCEDSGGLRFTSEMPRECDIFYSSGTLQYLRDPMAVLERGMASAKSFVILRRNHFADRTVFDIQRPWLWENGDGPVPDGFPNVQISYPRQTLVRADIEAMAKRLGFTLLLASEGDGLLFRR